jgi:hypothetical protein
LDEKLGSEKVHVAEGVCFIATANVGNEYTATRVMDKACLTVLPSRLKLIFLSQNTEMELIKNRLSRC